MKINEEKLLDIVIRKLKMDEEIALAHIERRGEELWVELDFMYEQAGEWAETLKYEVEVITHKDEMLFKAQLGGYKTIYVSKHYKHSKFDIDAEWK